MDAWNSVLSAGAAIWHGGALVYGALLKLGVVGCMLAVVAGLQISRKGLRLTDLTSGLGFVRRGQWGLGVLLQACGSAVLAIAMVALMHAMVR